MAFYALIVRRAEVGSPIHRGFTGDDWQFKAVACLLCFSALAALAMRLVGLAVQFGALERRPLPAPPEEGQAVTDVEDLLGELDLAPRSFDATYYGQRLRRTLELVRQRGTADKIEDDMRAQAGDVRRAMADRYASVRMMTASVPLVGLAGAAAALTMSLSGAAA